MSREKKIKKKRISVADVPNGYVLTVNKHEYMTFSPKELAAAVFYHVLLDEEEYVNKDISENLMTAAATWPTAGEAIQGNATLMAEIKDARREARVARKQNSTLSDKVDLLLAENRDLREKYAKAKVKADMADKYKQRADTTYELYNQEKKYSSALNKELLRYKRREEVRLRSDERKKKRTEEKQTNDEP